ncbi:MAG: hypothetical protein QM778_38915 [Myxococcales bacterium]
MRPEPSQAVAPFIALGRSLDAAFRRINYADDAFSGLATEHLERAGLHESFDLRELARWALLTSDLPQQADLLAEFGQPPLTLWNGRRFHIALLVWRNSTTTIHQHAFAGAFQVLQGGSMHTRYAFEPSCWLTEELGFGALRCLGSERLVRGDVRPIESAAGGIHALFHLEHPSVSLVVRTHTDKRQAIQYDYDHPGVAKNPFRSDPQQVRALQLARMLLRTDRAAAEELLDEYLEQATVADAFEHLDRLAGAGEYTLAQRLLRRIEGRFAGFAEQVEAALSGIHRTNFLVGKRDAVREPELRYFLAILLNAPNAQEVRRLASAFAPERAPGETLTTWLESLSKVKLKLQAGGLPWEPNIFGLPEPDAASLSLLRRALSGEALEPDQSTPFFRAVRADPIFAPLFRE